MLATTWVRIAVLGALVMAGCARPVVVHAPHALAPLRGITVTGVGEAKAPPDVARTNVGVEVRAETVEQATAQSNERMTAILAALRQVGIADADLRTHSFSISFEQAPVPPWPVPHAESAPAGPEARTKAEQEIAPPPAARGVYRASNMVEVTVRDLGKTGKVLQAATDAGANNVWGISFELEDPRSLIAEARVKAVESARQNAEALAQLSGVKLGAVVSVSEGAGGPGPMPMYEMKSMAAQGGDVPVERGEITVTQQVQVVYALPEP
jgi:uncharacterized protein